MRGGSVRVLYYFRHVVVVVVLYGDEPVRVHSSRQDIFNGRTTDVHWLHGGDSKATIVAMLATRCEKIRIRIPHHRVSRFGEIPVRVRYVVDL